MTTTVLDTLAYAERLKAAGEPEAQAEAQAEALAAAITSELVITSSTIEPPRPPRMPRQTI
jgi:hypothetical protein